MFTFENGHMVIAAMARPMFVQVGPLGLSWYGLAYLCGIFGGWYLLTKMLQRSNPPLTREQLWDLVFWIFGGVFIGGRLGFILFYNSGYYLAHPLEMLQVWNGGMSFHGGALGVLAAVFLFARRHKLQGLRLLDYIVVVQPLGQFLGRIANFFNGELWGAPTDAPWGVIFHGADAVDTPRHPTQLYEAFLEGALLFAVLNLLFWQSEARNKPGFLSGIYLIGYACFRFAVEFVREPDAQLAGLTGPLHMGQWLCLPMLAVGAGLIVRSQSVQN